MLSKIKQQLVKKRDDYEKQYKQWCLDNPGYVMNNLSIKVMAYDKILSFIDNYKSIDSLVLTLEAMRIQSLSTYGKMKNTMNGHFIHSETYKEIIINIKCYQKKLLTN